MREATENMSLDILQKKVEEFRLYLASLKTEEDYNISMIMNKLNEIFSLSNYYDNIFELKINKFWRARSNDTGDLFFNQSDFDYPKWKDIPQDKWKYERFNLPGESMWYLTNSRNACISEIKPTEGSIISCAYIRYLRNRELSFLLLDKPTLKKSDPLLSQLIEESIKQRNNKHSQTQLEVLSIVDKLMNEIATKKVDSDKRFEYIPSIAIQQLFLLSGFDGIIYPSIAFGQNAINFVLFPRVIDENFFVDELITFGVVKAEIDKFYEISPLLVGKNFIENDSSFIKWQSPSSEQIIAYSHPIEINLTSCTS